MSVVTNLILSMGVIDDDDGKVGEVNEFFEGKCYGLVSLDDPVLPRGWYGGSKMLEVGLYVGAFNCLDLRAFHNHLREIEWEQPEAVQLMVKEQEDFAFRPINVFPDKYEIEQQEMIATYKEGDDWPEDFMAQQLILEAQRLREAEYMAESEGDSVETGSDSLLTIRDSGRTTDDSA